MITRNGTQALATPFSIIRSRHAAMISILPASAATKIHAFEVKVKYIFSHNWGEIYYIWNEWVSQKIAWIAWSYVFEEAWSPIHKITNLDFEKLSFVITLRARSHSSPFSHALKIVVPRFHLFSIRKTYWSFLRLEKQQIHSKAPTIENSLKLRVTLALQKC